MMTINNAPVAQATLTFGRAWNANLWMPTDDILSDAITLSDKDGRTWKGELTHQAQFGGQTIATAGCAARLGARIARQAYRQTNVRSVVSHLIAQAGMSLDPASSPDTLRKRITVLVVPDSNLNLSLNLLDTQHDVPWRVTGDGAILIAGPAEDDASQGLFVTSDEGGLVRGYTEGLTVMPGMAYQGRRVRVVNYGVSPEGMGVEVYC